MRIQKITPQNSYSNPKFGANLVLLGDSEKLIEKSFKNSNLTKEVADFDISSYVKKLKEVFETYTASVNDGIVQIFDGVSAKDEKLVAVYRNSKGQQIDGRIPFLIEDLFKGKDNLSVKPIVDSLNQSQYYSFINRMEKSPFKNIEIAE